MLHTSHSNVLGKKHRPSFSGLIREAKKFSWVSAFATMTPVLGCFLLTSNVAIAISDRDTHAPKLAVAAAGVGYRWSFINAFELQGGIKGVETANLRYLDQIGLPVQSSISTHFTVGSLGWTRNCTFDTYVNGLEGMLQVLLVDDKGNPKVDDFPELFPADLNRFRLSTSTSGSYQTVSPNQDRTDSEKVESTGTRRSAKRARDEDKIFN